MPGRSRLILHATWAARLSLTLTTHAQHEWAAGLKSGLVWMVPYGKVREDAGFLPQSSSPLVFLEVRIYFPGTLTLDLLMSYIEVTTMSRIKLNITLLRCVSVPKTDISWALDIGPAEQSPDDTFLQCLPLSHALSRETGLVKRQSTQYNPFWTMCSTWVEEFPVQERSVLPVTFLRQWWPRGW
jgi:hypothetical protein